MIIVTGAAGFIGSNLVHALNARGRRDIIAVDNLARAEKFRNLVGADIADYLDKREFLERLDAFAGAEAILHQGACSDTMESDGRYMMENNYRYSMRLLEFTARHRIRIKAFLAHMFGQGPAAIGALHVKDFRRQQAKRGLAAGIGSWEPLPGFLGPNGHHRHVAGGLKPGTLHAGHRRKPRQNPGGAIEIPALTHGIEVTAHDDPLSRAVGPRQGHIQIARDIIAAFQAEFFGGVAHQLMRNTLTAPIGFARDTFAIACGFSQRVKQPRREVHIRGQIGQHEQAYSMLRTRPPSTRIMEAVI